MHDLVPEAGKSPLASFCTPAEAAPRLRVALVGCVNAPLQYAAALSAHPRVVLVALVDSDRSAARAWSRPLGTRIPIFETVAELLADTLEIDASVVVSPIEARASDASMLLAAGVAVLCEPPCAATLAAADALLETAGSTEALLMPAFTRRFEPGITELARRAAGGEVGTPRQVRCGWRFPCLSTSVEIPADAETRGWRTLWPSLACQTVDLARWWLGEAISVSADLDVYEEGEDRRARRMEAFANIIVNHEHGHAIHQLARVRSTVAEEQYKLTGADGEIEITLSGPGVSPDEAARPVLRPFWRPAGPLVADEAEEIDPMPTQGSAPVARCRRLLAHFADCVNAGAVARLQASDLRAAVEIACAAILSSSDQTKVAIPLRGAADAGAVLVENRSD
jgi:predicted dehydrogenase